MTIRHPFSIRIKRAYSKPDRTDGDRVLVDRIWPRGMTKEEAKIDDWIRTVAPSDDLRKWFHQDTHRWDDFKIRYFQELDGHPEEVKRLAEKAERGPLTLIFSAKDEEHNNAVVLKEYLEKFRPKMKA